MTEPQKKSTPQYNRLCDHLCVTVKLYRFNRRERGALSATSAVNN